MNNFTYYKTQPLQQPELYRKVKEEEKFQKLSKLLNSIYEKPSKSSFLI